MTEPGERAGDDDVLRTYGSGPAGSKARRRGNTVTRDSGPWSPTVIALLQHYERVGFTGAPRVVGTGFDTDGHETIEYLPGGSPHPRAWPDDAAAQLGVLLRAAHDAGRTFRPPTGAVWQDWFGRALPGDELIIGHCDTGPWNIVAADDGSYALLDWEFAGPVDARWELAQAAWLNAQLHDDDVAAEHGLPDIEVRTRQARLILDGYGLTRRERAGMVDRMIEFAVHSARAEAIEFGVDVGTPAGRDSGGYPVLWAVTWRVRSASWMLRHRAELTAAIES